MQSTFLEFVKEQVQTKMSVRLVKLGGMLGQCLYEWMPILFMNTIKHQLKCKQPGGMIHILQQFYPLLLIHSCWENAQSLCQKGPV